MRCGVKVLYEIFYLPDGKQSPIIERLGPGMDYQIVLLKILSKGAARLAMTFVYCSTMKIDVKPRRKAKGTFYEESYGEPPNF